MNTFIEQSAPSDPDAMALIAQLDDHQRALYPEHSQRLMTVQQLEQPDVRFFLMHQSGEAIGCAAFVDVNGQYAEIKRMYVRPEYRGQALGRRLLRFVEDRARFAGLRIARLETGVAQPEAIGLYERCGYVRRGPFGDYADDPLSVFMEKVLV